MADSLPGLESQMPHEPFKRRGLVASVGGIGAAFLASLCCIGPLVFVAFGVGAGLASTFEPFQSMFTVLTIIFLAVGFYTVYGKKGGSLPGKATDADAGSASIDRCVVPGKRKSDKVILWVATVLAALLLTFPRWSGLLV